MKSSQLKEYGMTSISLEKSFFKKQEAWNQSAYFIVCMISEKYFSDYICIIIIVRGSNPPLFKAPTSSPSLPSLFPLPLFLFHPILRNFTQFPPPSHNPLLPFSDSATFHSVNKYQKCDFTSSTAAFYQKSIFNHLNPFTNRLS